MTTPPLYLGTSSWTAAGWEKAFYPPGTKQANYLTFYATQFNTVEIDSTFYRTPSANTVQQWHDRTPEGLIFAAKLPQSITHDKALVGADGDLKAFLSVMDLLGPKLGPLLIQLPYFNKQKFDGCDAFLNVLEPFLKGLPKDHRWALEIRNKGWISEKLLSLLCSHGVAFALIDHPWMYRPTELCRRCDPITADFTYIRWLGDRKAIEERTLVWDKTIIDRRSEIAEWVKVLRELLERRIRIFAFANNHYGGFGPDTVREFQERWSHLASSVPQDRSTRATEKA